MAPQCKRCGVEWHCLRKSSRVRAHPEEIRKYLDSELKHVAVIWPFVKIPFGNFAHFSPIDTRPKKDWRVVHHHEPVFSFLARLCQWGHRQGQLCWWQLYLTWKYVTPLWMTFVVLSEEKANSVELNFLNVICERHTASCGCCQKVFYGLFSHLKIRSILMSP